MATYTTNLNLIKPAGTDKIRIAQLNQNSDTLDAAIGAVGNTSLQAQATATSTSLAATQGGIAIVATGNTHAAIASGQFVYVKGHTTLAEGMYVASAAIAANATLSGTNLTAVSGGGLNALNTNIANLTTPETHTITKSENIGSTSFIACVTIGKLCLIQMSINVNSNAPTNAELFSGAPIPRTGIGAYGNLGGTGKSLAVAINSAGKCTIEGTPGTNTGWMNGVFAYTIN